MNKEAEEAQDLIVLEIEIDIILGAIKHTYNKKILCINQSFLAELDKIRRELKNR